jgi:hypothetical protein
MKQLLDFVEVVLHRIIYVNCFSELKLKENIYFLCYIYSTSTPAFHENHSGFYSMEIIVSIL